MPGGGRTGKRHQTQHGGLDLRATAGSRSRRDDRRRPGRPHRVRQLPGRGALRLRRQELLGESVERLVPKRFATVHPGLRDGYFVEPRTRPMAAGIELFGRRRDGSEFPAEISLSSIETGQGRLATAAIRDIGERAESERGARPAAPTGSGPSPRERRSAGRRHRPRLQQHPRGDPELRRVRGREPRGAAHRPSPTSKRSRRPPNGRPR